MAKPSGSKFNSFKKAITSQVGAESEGGSITMSNTKNSKMSGTYVTSTIHEISNGICTFSPTSNKGRMVFLFQTILLSFTPIMLLIVQNGISFGDMIKMKNDIIHKDNLVSEATQLSNCIISLQLERAMVALAVFLDVRSGKATDLSKEYANTDAALQLVRWRDFGTERIFENKLRFQIRIDDFRERVTKVTLLAKNSTRQVSDTEVLEFYNLATSKMLTGLEEDLSKAQSGKNWRLLISYFNMIQLIESSGIGLVYGLRFYATGKLDESDIVSYVRTNALLYEYYKQAKELVPDDIGRDLNKLFTSKEFQIVNTSTTQILANEVTEISDKQGRKYFEGSLAFQATLNSILNSLVRRVRRLAEDDIGSANVSQIWGVALLLFVMVLSPILVILAKNAISSIQVFAVSVEKKSADMRKQKKKQDKLIYKMLPKDVVDRLNSGAATAENFESATLFFSTVVDFANVTKKCKALEVIAFLNDLYSTLDERMDQHDVYKVESISDSYLVASGLPKKNGDKHASEICRMALDLQAASGMIVRPDIRPKTIELKCGIHTGPVVAGVVGSKMPRYCLFGDTINTASRMQSTSEAGKIQISNSTNMILDMQGGFKTEERGGVEVKGKGLLQTFWLIEEKRIEKIEPERKTKGKRDRDNE